jgi:multimeric flavodoxin WrbA
MKIGVFIHSQSGHTAALGMALVHKLRGKGHDVDIELLRSVKRARPFMKHVELKKDPEIDGYDIIVLGGPVWFLHPSPLLLSFIDEVPHLKNKKALCFVTSGFPGKFSGGKSVLRKINAKFDALGASVLEAQAYWWGLWPDTKRMGLAAQKISDTLLQGQI